MWPALLGVEFKDGVFPGLPWFLDDARPQGFLGRAFARKYGVSLGQSNNPADWSNAAVAESLLRFGNDLPGAFVLGRDALARAMAGRDVSVVEAPARSRVFPELAEAVLNGEVTGSSAGGEQPKFSAAIRIENRLDHVLVKFSSSRTTPEGQRWADLLAAEMLAARILEAQGFETPRVEVFDFADRRYLQVSRFDRTPAGRVPVVSLRAVDSAFFGLLHAPWDAAADTLLEAGWIGESDAGRLASLGVFGRLIHNTDMHFGNASLILSPRLPARLAPVYDMLPMGYRPGLEGRLPGFSETALPNEHESAECDWAVAFWDAVATSDLVSDDFRKIAESHREAISQATREKRRA